MNENYYQILGIAELTASPEEIKLAYRRQAQRWHPDRHPNQPSSVERFQAIQSAYQILSDVARKLAYDQELRATQQAQQARFETVSSHPEPVPDWQDSLRHREEKARQEWDKNGPGGYHIHLSLKVNWQEALKGSKRTIAVRVAETCQVCGGHNRLCATCAGTGQVFYNRVFGISIPKGSLPGETLRLFGQGHSGPRTSGPGDILIKLKFELPYPWHLEEGVLVRPLVLSRQQAREGGELELKSLIGGSGKIHLPGLLVEGQRVRLLRQGWADREGETSDAFLIIKIKN